MKNKGCVLHSLFYFCTSLTVVKQQNLQHEKETNGRF